MGLIADFDRACVEKGWWVGGSMGDMQDDLRDDQARRRTERPGADIIGRFETKGLRW